MVRLAGSRPLIRVQVYIPLCLLLVAYACAKQDAGDLEVKAPVAERQLQNAVALRSKQDATKKDLQHAAALLIAAARVKLPGPMNVTAHSSNLTLQQPDPEYTSGVQFTAESNVDALRELARAYEAGEGVPVDVAIAQDLFKHAAKLGDPDAQADMAVRYALGIQPSQGADQPLFELTSPDIPKALLNYFFAANGNDSYAQMALGYRHMYGVDVPQSCQASLLYYHPVAEQVVQEAQHPGRLPQIERVRLNYKSAGMRRPSKEQEVLHYQWFADLGSVEAQRAVGHLFSHGALRNPEQALRYFKQAADVGDADALAHMGHMYMNGMGVQQDNETAVHFLRGAADGGASSGLFGLGYMYLTGHSMQQDYRKAFKLLQAASELGNAEAWFHLGTMYLNGWGVKPSQRQAVDYFALAAQMGHVLGMYNLAMMHLHGRAGLAGAEGRTNCPPALALLKKIAEKGSWGALVQQGYEAFADGDVEPALLHYLQAAELGSELGQSNAAWMLMHGYGYTGPHAAQLAISLYKKAAAQGNHEALLQVGDSYYYGRGVPRDWTRAAQMYTEASQHRVAQASYNLGFMHEYGAGLPQDLHLAKRYYDKALEAQSSAYLPIMLALIGLSAHSKWLHLKPYLPESWLKQRLFVLRQAEQGTVQDFGSSSSDYVSAAFALVDKPLAWLSHAGAIVSLMTDQLEFILLLAAGAGLWVVLQRRRRIRQRQQNVGQTAGGH